jgi:lysophospholipase L1-like esterase
MALTSSSKTRRFVALAAAGLAVGGTLVATVPADAAPSNAQAAALARQAPVKSGSVYLALGDSVSFGFREATNRPRPNYHKAKSFRGWPEVVASDLGLKLFNASCPGETSGSFLNVNNKSNGCENSRGGGPGYRDAYPLHVNYKRSQMRYAITFLKTHPNTKLVSLMIGANDGLLCLQSAHCNIGNVLTRVAKNVTTILTSIRKGAHYKGQIVIMNYYATDYRSANSKAQSLALNNTVDSSARPFHARFAGGYGAFRKASAQTHGNDCAAGLLTILSGGGCGIHPSVAGQALLATAAERVITK